MLSLQIVEAEVDLGAIEVVASEAVEVSAVEIVVAMEVVAVAAVVEDLEVVATKWVEGWLMFPDNFFFLSL